MGKASGKGFIDFLSADLCVFSFKLHIHLLLGGWGLSYLISSTPGSVPTHRAARTGRQWRWWSSPHWWPRTGSSRCPSCPGPGSAAENRIPSCGWWYAGAPARPGRRSSATARWAAGFRPPCSAESLSGLGLWWCCSPAPGNSESTLQRRTVREEQTSMRARREGCLGLLLGEGFDFSLT